MTTLTPSGIPREVSESSPDWQPYYSIYPRDLGHRISGNIVVGRNVGGPRLKTRRNILVYLPPSYEQSQTRYPVLYMHDGQNLFDQATSFAGEWGVDETMERLAREEKLEAIVVGIPNGGRYRTDEYSPFVMPRLGGGRGEEYLSFLAYTLKPIIDRDFRTLPDPKNTGLVGSSLGGLISLYGFFRFSDVYGLAGVLSPSLWFGGEGIYDYIASANFAPGRIYLDAGTRELGEDLRDGIPHRATSSRQYYASVRRMKRILIRKGYRPTIDLLHVEEKWAGHSESSWSRRFPNALRFLLSDSVK